MSEFSEQPLTLSCDCSCHYLTVTSDSGDERVYLAFYEHVGAGRNSFIKRIKSAWEMLTKGHLAWDIVLDRVSAKKLQQYLEDKLV